MGATEFQTRLQPATYRDDAEVHFGVAEKGRDPAEWVGVPERLVSRLTCLGEGYELQHIPMIDIYDDTRFNSKRCENLNAELQFLSGIVDDPALEKVLETLSTLAKSAVAKSWSLFVSGN